MGKAFGNLHYVRGIVFYRLSPFEQKSFAGIINPGLYNTARRFRESVFRVVPRKYSLLINLQLFISMKNSKNFNYPNHNKKFSRK